MCARRQWGTEGGREVGRAAVYTVVKHRTGTAAAAGTIYLDLYASHTCASRRWAAAAAVAARRTGCGAPAAATAVASAGVARAAAIKKRVKRKSFVPALQVNNDVREALRLKASLVYFSSWVHFLFSYPSSQAQRPFPHQHASLTPRAHEGSGGVVVNDFFLSILYPPSIFWGGRPRPGRRQRRCLWRDPSFHPSI